GALGRDRHRAEVGAVDVFHRQVVIAIDHIDVEHRGDIVVIEHRDQARLVEEHRARLGIGGAALAQDLERDVALELAGAHAARQIDIRHPTLRQRPEELVAPQPIRQQLIRTHTSHRTSYARWPRSDSHYLAPSVFRYLAGTWAQLRSLTGERTYTLRPCAVRIDSPVHSWATKLRRAARRRPSSRRRSASTARSRRGWRSATKTRAARRSAPAISTRT